MTPRRSSGRLSLATDGSHFSGYDPSVLDEVLNEAAWLLKHLGFAAKHTVLIGGLAPSLLVLDPPQPHLGTTDLDLCLTLAIVDGDTAEYERIEVSLSKAGYAPTDTSFRWKRSTGLQLDVEFFCPSGPERPAGRMFRPNALENPTAKHNWGSKLAAIALDFGAVISADARVIEREVRLPSDQGRMMFPFSVTGPLGFLLAKTAALLGRVKHKDAYDIVWLLENWPGGPAALAHEITQSPAYTFPETENGLDRLFDAFGSPDSIGAVYFVQFSTDGDNADGRVRLARQAVGAVRELRTALNATGTADA